MVALETRNIGLYLPATPEEGLELRAIQEQGKPAKLVGYAAVYNSRSGPMMGGKLVEVILPGAFKASLASGGDIRALVDHDPAKLLGRRSNGTLRLFDDPKGLRFEVDLPDTSYARDLMASVTRGDIQGCSFGFRLNDPAGQGLRFEGGLAIRELKNVELGEVSACSIPAYGATSVEVRCNPDLMAKIDEMQKSENSGQNLLVKQHRILHYHLASR